MAKTDVCFRLAVGVDAAKDSDLAGVAFGEEEIAIGRDADEARIVEAGGVELDLESLGRDGPGVGGARNDGGAVVDGLLGRGRGQIGDGEVAARAGGLVSASVKAAWPVRTGGLVEESLGGGAGGCGGGESGSKTARPLKADMARRRCG